MALLNAVGSLAAGTWRKNHTCWILNPRQCYCTKSPCPWRGPGERMALILPAQVGLPDGSGFQTFEPASTESLQSLESSWRRGQTDYKFSILCVPCTNVCLTNLLAWWSTGAHYIKWRVVSHIEETSIRTEWAPALFPSPVKTNSP